MTYRILAATANTATTPTAKAFVSFHTPLTLRQGRVYCFFFSINIDLQNYSWLNLNQGQATEAADGTRWYGTDSWCCGCGRLVHSWAFCCFAARDAFYNLKRKVRHGAVRACFFSTGYSVTVMCGIVGAIRAHHNVVDFLTDGLKRLEWRVMIHQALPSTPTATSSACAVWWSGACS